MAHGACPEDDGDEAVTGVIVHRKRVDVVRHHLFSELVEDAGIEVLADLLRCCFGGTAWCVEGVGQVATRFPAALLCLGLQDVQACQAVEIVDSAVGSLVLEDALSADDTRGMVLERHAGRR